MIRFGHLDIDFDERVLTPRPWTARQSVWAADLLPGLPDGPVLELCSGAGQIGLLAVAESDRALICVDVNPAAAEFTLRNAERAGVADRVEVRTAHMAQALAPEERFGLIIADPPWVPSDEVARYPEDPTTAIDGGPDGMLIVGMCLEVILGHLAPGGAAILQLGTLDQVDRVATALQGSDLAVREVRDSPGQGSLALLTRP